VIGDYGVGQRRAVGPKPRVLERSAAEKTLAALGAASRRTIMGKPGFWCP